MAVTAPAPARARTDPPKHRLAAIRILRNRALATLMLGHFTVDMYVGVIPMLYPLLRDTFALSLETVGYVSLAYGGAASLSQPLFGLLADRKGTRLVGLALFWTAATFALLGFVSSFTVLLILTRLVPDRSPLTIVQLVASNEPRLRSGALHREPHDPEHATSRADDRLGDIGPWHPRCNSIGAALR